MVKGTITDKKFSIIKEVASTIISTDNLETITNLILDLALSYTKAKSGSILLLDRHGNLVIKAAKGIDPELIPNLSIKLGENICGRVAKDKTPLLVKDIKRDRRVKKRGRNGKYETRSFICCPIVKKDKLLGVINITDKGDSTPFTEDDYDLIDILANQTAIALENAHLMSELRLKALELDERNKKLIDLDKFRTEFIARMSHELRTPLNAINGAVYYLKEKKFPKKERAEFVEIISDETKKLIDLLEDLLNFTSLEREELPINKKIINIADILQEAIDSKIVKDALVSKKIFLNVKQPEFLSDIVGEKIRLMQAIIHLIEGITNYAAEGDSIKLRITEKKTCIEVEFFIKDRAIPHNDLQSLFDERSLWSGNNNKNNKLKFYLAKKTIDLHKGTISASNTPRGMSILITLPKSVKEYRNAKIDELMNLFLSFISEAMDIHKCSIMLSDDSTGELVIRSAFGIDKEIIRKTRVRINDKIAGLVAAENKPLLVEDIEKDSLIGRENRPQYNTKSLLCVPIVLEDRVIGVLNLNNKSNAEPFNEKDLYLATVFSDRISHLIGKVQRDELQNSDFKETVKSMEALINAERHYKKKNGKLRDLVFNTMKRLGRSEGEIKLALYTSGLYDLGLTQIDKSILEKRDSLSIIEQKILRTHPFPGVGLINHIETDEHVKKIILHHHERYDGKGYPDRLRGDDIPFTSRVISVVDSYTAMTADRPYRKALSKRDAIKQIKAGAGTQFDPAVVKAFTQIV